MNTLEWKEKFSVHVEEMDSDHKQLLGYFAELQNGLADGDPSRTLGDTLKALYDYAGHHFAEEERLMQSLSFPDLEAHSNQHAYFTNELNEMYKQYRMGALPNQSVFSFLRDWFLNHIMQEDLKYGRMVKP